MQKFLYNSNNTRGRGKTAYKGDEDLEDKPPPDNQNFIPPPHKPYFTLLATTVMFALFVWELVRAISPWSWKNHGSGEVLQILAYTFFSLMNVNVY